MRIKPKSRNIPTPTNVVDLAANFAANAHASIQQKRKYTFEPYIVHPQAVVQRLKSLGVMDDITLAAAWCHDVLEDTPVTFEELEDALGSEVADLVFEVSDIGESIDGGRVERKVLDLKHISEGSVRCHLIKKEDALDNLLSLESHAPEFALVWIGEKLAMSEVLTHLNTEARTMLSNELMAAKSRIESSYLNRWLRSRALFNGVSP